MARGTFVQGLSTLESILGHYWRSNSPTTLHSGDPQTNRGKLRIGCLDLTFSGTKRGRKCDKNPTFAGFPNEGGKVQA